MITTTTPIDFVREKLAFQPQIARRARAEAEAELWRARAEGKALMREASNRALSKLEGLPGAKDDGTGLWFIYSKWYFEVRGTMTMEWVET